MVQIEILCTILPCFKDGSTDELNLKVLTFWNATEGQF